MIKATDDEHHNILEMMSTINIQKKKTNTKNTHIT